MQIIHAISEIRSRLSGEPSIAFVPTMGNLHAGHLELVRIAREQGHCVVVSIFVNPLQFGAGEDFGSYPRSLQADCAQLELHGVDVVFAPSERELYPVPQRVAVEPPLADDLCGAFRPGHFRGVATVVLKLFNIVQPQAAVFGKKDYQQLVVIRQVAQQLNLPIAIFGGETVRASDGLALSSRNHYLSAAQRSEAAFLHQMLSHTRQALLAGATDYAALEHEGAEALGARGWQVDYVAIREQCTLAAPAHGAQDLVVLAAARLGTTRLIDNIEVGMGG